VTGPGGVENLKLIMRLPNPLSSLFLVSAAVPLVTAAGQPLADHSKCGCYLTNGTESRYFSHHAFFDFRSLSQHAGVPPVITNSGRSGAAPVTSKYFGSEEWTKWWIMGNWNNSKGQRADASVLMVHSPNNVYIEANNDKNAKPETWLTLRTQRLKDDREFQTASEIESRSMGFRFLSVRMMARTLGSPGAITALFTYKHSDDIALVQEADLEMRTIDESNIIHYTNQPSYTAKGEVITQATQNATLPDGLKWTDWAVHRLDWTPERNTWYVNGKQVAQIAFQTPRDNSKVILNAWSDGGQWSGNMSLNDAAYLQVQWFEIVYNSTEAVDHSHMRRGIGASAEDNATSKQIEPRASVSNGVCNSVCSIDETPTQGQPVMLWDNGAGQLLKKRGATGWIPSFMMLVMVFFSGDGLR